MYVWNIFGFPILAIINICIYVLFVIPAKAGNYRNWIPTFVGMTIYRDSRLHGNDNTVLCHYRIPTFVEMTILSVIPAKAGI